MKTVFLNYLSVLICLIGVSSSVNSQSEIWEKLLNNERSEALELSKKLPTDNIDQVIINEIVRSENGLFIGSEEFVQQLAKAEEREPYLFALWNERFLFDAYLSRGFNRRTASNLDVLFAKEYTNTTLRGGLDYLKAVKERAHYNFFSYKSLVSKIPAIREWQVCGVFENLNNSALNKEYGPEKFPQSTGGFNANSNGIVDWYVPEWSGNHVYLFFENHGEYGTGVHYAQTFFESTEEKRVTINVGASGKFKLWLDDVEIYENNETASTEMDAYSVEITIPKGKHRLLLKLANAGSGGYSLVRMKELDGSPVKDISFSSTYTEYMHPTLEQLNLKLMQHPMEAFFIEKLKADPDNFLYSYCLVQTYLRNQRYKQAKKILLPLEEKYPKSSLLRSLLIRAYSIEGDYAIIEQLEENMQLDDEFYFGSLTYKFKDISGLMRMSMEDMSSFLDRYALATDLSILGASIEMIKAFRIEDNAQMRRSLDELMAIAIEDGEAGLIRTYSGLYKSALNDEKRAMKYLEKLNKKRFDTGVQRLLMRHYNSLNRHDKIIAMLKKNVVNMENDIDIYKELINYLHFRKKYAEAEPYIEKALKLFPYSFVLMEYDGDNKLQTGRVDEAVESYKKSLVHNSGNSSLRRIIRDIADEKDAIEAIRNKDIYTYISDNRGSGIENNYGYNTLMDEAIIELYTEAGGRGRYSLIYEITTEAGVEGVKEYNLNLSGSYDIIKSEIVKPSGAVIPADRYGSSLVFEGLEIGDVINIDYEVNFNGSGRFYKDYVDSYMFDSYHPAMYSRYVLLVPKGMDFNYEVTVGELPLKKTSTERHDKYVWELDNVEALPQTEYYMPETCDIARTLHISTIDSWNEIATWYSDLVRSQLIINSEVQSAFDSCFEGKNIESMTDEEKAKTIYDFMMARLTYSFVSFRQSGFVPQKPSRTLTTNLGDCKDFSSLFVLFSRMADLESNLVLVLTSNYGVNEIVLPSTDFNHCIVKVNMDGEDQYLELTNKHLPFKALPTSLLNAMALEIPYSDEDLTQTYDLKTLSNINRSVNKVSSHVEMKINGGTRNYSIDTKVYGATKSYQSEILENPNMKIIEEEMLDRFSSSIDGDLKIDSVYGIENDRTENFTRFICDMTQKEKTNKIGSFKILRIPSITDAYTDNIVRDSERKFAINYKGYESIDNYVIVYDIYLEEGEEFVELPESVKLNYLKHSYSRTYEKISATHLRVSVEAIPDLADIAPENYEDFKTYIHKVLEAKDEFVGFK